MTSERDPEDYIQDILEYAEKAGRFLVTSRLLTPLLMMRRHCSL